MEATNAGEEEFGYERITRLLKESALHSSEQAADALLGAVSAWSASQQDDLTIIICDYKRMPQSRQAQL